MKEAAPSHGSSFLAFSRADMLARGWDAVDFVLITGDAYVDHPSFGAALIGRHLESHGYRVALLAQPDWRSVSDFQKFGQPRLAFLLTSGNVDSMVNHYSVSRKRRQRDVYSPGGRAGQRPDRAVIVYANRVKEAFPQVPIIIGGLEASLRRLGHYDYWDDAVRRSIVLDSRADLLVYGMGETQIIQIAEALDAGIAPQYITYIPGTVYATSTLEGLTGAVHLPSFDDTKTDKKQFAQSFRTQCENMDPIRGSVLIESYGTRFVVQNPPAAPLDREELDRIYRLPFTKEVHPFHEAQGGVPAIEEVKFSLVSNRGCFGDCSFCALAFHQGKHVESRSIESLMDEARELTNRLDFKGYIHDVGGPTANFRHPSCTRQLRFGMCAERRCLTPTPCPHLDIRHDEYVDLLRQLRQLPGVKKVFVRSGIRYDYLVHDRKTPFLEELCAHHISGQLKVAPEHVSDRVLRYMGKPPHEIYERFASSYRQINERLGKDQFLVPYFISSHPGCDLHCAIELAEYIRDHVGHRPKQVQDFYPTPGTEATCMFHTGLDPRTMRPVYVARTASEKAMQRALIQYSDRENYQLVYRALKAAGREDLIGYDAHCLIAPPKDNPRSSRKSTSR